MDWRWTLFSFEGRLPRLPFWVVAAAYTLGLPFLWVIWKRLSFLWPIVLLLLNLAVYPVLIWMALAVTLKRLHDRGRGVDWLLLYGLVPALCWRIASDIAAPRPAHAALVLMVLGWGVGVCGAIELLFVPGTRDTNRFDADSGLGRA